MLTLLRNIAIVCLLAFLAYYVLAGYGSGAGSQITGNVVLEQCMDADAGLAFDVAGVVKQGCALVPDCCKRNGIGPCVLEADSVAEAYCNNGEPDIFIHRCAYGCRDGACLFGNGSRTDIFSQDPSLIPRFRLGANCSNVSSPIDAVLDQSACDSVGCAARSAVRETASILGQLGR